VNVADFHASENIMSDPMTRARPARPTGRVWGRGGLLLLAGLMTLTGAGPAKAVNGEGSDTLGIFLVPASTCQPIRQRTGVHGDVLFGCDGNGEACELSTSGVNRETRSGIATYGFCDDQFPAVGPLERTDGVLKSEITILGSSFGSITGIKPPGTENAGDEASNIICGSFTLNSSFTTDGVKYGPGVRACRKVMPGTCGPGECQTSCPGEQADYFVTRADSCTEARQVIANSVSGTPPANLAFALFQDVEPASGSVATPGKVALLVCPNHKWQCVDPEERYPTDVAVDYRLPMGLAQEDPDYYATIKGILYTCTATTCRRAR
jgi:hypothetical protein